MNAKKFVGLEQITRNDSLLDNITILTKDLLFRTKTRHCFTVITDDLHQDILNAKLFKEMDRSSYILIKVANYEDMLEPTNKIIETLKEARRIGCETYLIYLANGIQVERFLRFIDELHIHI